RRHIYSFPTRRSSDLLRPEDHADLDAIQRQIHNAELSELLAQPMSKPTTVGDFMKLKDRLKQDRDLEALHKIADRGWLLHRLSPDRKSTRLNSSHPPT